MATEYLRGRGVSAIVETTLRDAAMLGGEFAAFRAAGYETQLRVVAVPLAVSRAGTLSRYVEQIKDFGAGRWTPGAAHDEAASKVRTTVAALVAGGVVDRVVVQDRAGRVLHDADVQAGGAGAGEAAAAAVDQACDVRRLEPDQAREWVQYTTAALRDRAQLGHDDPDLLQVARRLAIQDAAAVVVQAFPGDTAAQQRTLTDLALLVPRGAGPRRSDLARAMPDSLVQVRYAVEASFPRPAADVVQAKPPRAPNVPGERRTQPPSRSREAGRGEGRG